jgi:hypothetical protein
MKPDPDDDRWLEYARLRVAHETWTKVRCVKEAGFTGAASRSKAYKLERQPRVQAEMMRIAANGEDQEDSAWTGFDCEIIPSSKEEALRRIEAKQWELAASHHGPTAARALEYLGKVYRLEEHGGKAASSKSEATPSGPMTTEEALRVRAEARA